jgi:DNA-binding MarR family transcriptional regulator
LAGETALPPAPATDPDVSADLYALLTFLNKSCTPDLFETLGSLELTLTQIKLLHHLEAAPQPLTLGAAADCVLLSLAAASRTVDDLVRRGYVERHEDPADRRIKRVSLSNAGRAIILRLAAARLSALERFAETLTDEERAQLGSALRTLLARRDLAACRPGDDLRKGA